jgi:hypothetical protein
LAFIVGVLVSALVAGGLPRPVLVPNERENDGSIALAAVVMIVAIIIIMLIPARAAQRLFAGAACLAGAACFVVLSGAV